LASRSHTTTWRRWCGEEEGRGDLAVDYEEQGPGDHEEQVEREQDEPGGEAVWGGYRIQDTGYRIQDTGYRIQDTLCHST
jgi:hypothetical protein